MWIFNEDSGQWTFDGYTDLYCYSSRIYEYPVSMHVEKLYLSITEAAIATLQRIERENFREWRNSQR